MISHTMNNEEREEVIDQELNGEQKKSCRKLLRRRPVTEVVIRQDEEYSTRRVSLNQQEMHMKTAFFVFFLVAKRLNSDPATIMSDFSQAVSKLWTVMEKTTILLNDEFMKILELLPEKRTVA